MDLIAKVAPMAYPIEHNWQVIQGDCLPITLRWKTGNPETPVDLTGYEAEITLQWPSGIAVLSSVDSAVVLGGPTGFIFCVISNEYTWQWPQGIRVAWQLRIKAPLGNYFTLMSGRIRVAYAPVGYNHQCISIENLMAANEG